MLPVVCIHTVQVLLRDGERSESICLKCPLDTVFDCSFSFQVSVHAHCTNCAAVSAHQAKKVSHWRHVMQMGIWHYPNSSSRRRSNVSFGGGHLWPSGSERRIKYSRSRERATFLSAAISSRGYIIGRFSLDRKRGRKIEREYCTQQQQDMRTILLTLVRQWCPRPKCPLSVAIMAKGQVKSGVNACSARRRRPSGPRLEEVLSKWRLGQRQRQRPASEHRMVSSELKCVWSLRRDQSKNGQENYWHQQQKQQRQQQHLYARMAHQHHQYYFIRYFSILVPSTLDSALGNCKSTRRQVIKTVQ